MNWQKGIREQADLKVDCDTHRHNPIQRFNFRAKYLMRYFPQMSPMKIKVYRTKKGFHFYIYTKDEVKNKETDDAGTQLLNDLETVLVQLILGSDWLRELRNINRISKGDKNWNLLFSEKVKKGKRQQEKFYCAYTLKG